MVSFHTPFSPNQRRITSDSDEDSSKKRKWDDQETKAKGLEINPWKNHKRSTRSLNDIQLQLETPLPSEWQRCLDIQSGEIHFYNTRTQTRTLKDPRASPEPSSPIENMSLDLELNLPCGTLNNEYSSSSEKSTSNKVIKQEPSGADPWLRLSTIMKRDAEDKCQVVAADMVVDEDEMVATACMQCHMLVMLCKSSPTCPNCKFMHPLDQGLPDLFKPRLSLAYHGNAKKLKLVSNSC